MSAWEDLRLGDAVFAGVSASDRIRVWAHGRSAGPHVLRAFRGDRCVAHSALDLGAETGLTGAATLELEDCAGERVEVQLWRDGEALASCHAKLCPGEAAWKNQRLSFAVASCHQPFTEAGDVLPASASMLAGARAQLQRDDVAFALLMGDQLYADAPASKSLFNPEYFESLHQGEDILGCSAERIRRVLHRRYERFAAVPGFADLLSSTATIPMPDDHEFIDNFGTHPDHGSARWASFKQGALQAYWDHQGARASLAQVMPESLDYGFTWGPVAVYGLDLRSNRITCNETTRVYTKHQFESLRAFLDEHGGMPALALMTSIPLVHAEPGVVDAAASVLHLGSDLHERWSHSSCIEQRDAVLGLLIEHAQRNPKQKVILLGGDVHAGFADQIDFPECGVQMVQLTSSPLSNEEGWLNARAGELAAKAVFSVELADGRKGVVTSLRGRTKALDRNPFGGLNIGLVDISTDSQGLATVSLRLVGHDGNGAPTNVFDTGPLGRRPDPDRNMRIA